MNFCDGELGELERMMKEVPNFGKKFITLKDRDCPCCLHWDQKKRECRLEECPYFD